MKKGTEEKTFNASWTWTGISKSLATVLDAVFHFTIYLVHLCNKNKSPYPCSRPCHYFPPGTCELKSAKSREGVCLPKPELEATEEGPES